MKKQGKIKISAKARQEVQDVFKKVVDEGKEAAKEANAKAAKSIEILLEAISFESTFSMALGQHPENNETHYLTLPSVTVADKVHLFNNITNGLMMSKDMTDDDVLVLGRILDGAVDRIDVFSNSLSKVIYEDLAGLVNINLIMALFNEINRVSQLFRVAQIALVAERGDAVFSKEANMSIVEFAEDMVADSTLNPNRTFEEISAALAAEAKEAATKDD